MEIRTVPISIGAQDIEKDIMVKCFVTFEDVKDISKNRRALVNRSVFSCYDSHGNGDGPVFHIIT